MSKRILSVSYDMSLLATRKMLLEQNGYDVDNALGFSKALTSCRVGGFDLFILAQVLGPDPSQTPIGCLHYLYVNQS
jgi:DNA-binding response OmpR family regulator